MKKSFITGHVARRVVLSKAVVISKSLISVERCCTLPVKHARSVASSTTKKTRCADCVYRYFVGTFVSLHDLHNFFCESGVNQHHHPAVRSKRWSLYLFSSEGHIRNHYLLVFDVYVHNSPVGFRYIMTHLLTFWVTMCYFAFIFCGDSFVYNWQNWLKCTQCEGTEAVSLVIFIGPLTDHNKK